MKYDGYVCYMPSSVFESYHLLLAALLRTFPSLLKRSLLPLLVSFEFFSPLATYEYQILKKTDANFLIYILTRSSANFLSISSTLFCCSEV